MTGESVNIAYPYRQSTGRQTTVGRAGQYATQRCWVVGQFVRDDEQRVVFEPLECFETEQEAEAAQRRMMG